MPVCILGMHRSGTSMVTRLLNVCGLYIGPDDDLMPPHADDNPAGYWENLRFTELNDELLDALGGTWSHPPDLPSDWWKQPAFDDFRQRATTIISDFKDEGSWGWKDPRTCLTLPFWLDIVPNLHVVFCLRNPLEITLSLSRGQETRSLLAKDAMRLWDTYHEHLLRSIQPDQFITTHYATYFYKPEDELQRLLRALSIKATKEHIRAATETIEGSLRHMVFPGQDLPSDLVPSSVAQRYHTLSTQSGPIYQQMLADQTYRRNQVQSAAENQYVQLLNEADRSIQAVKKNRSMTEALEQIQQDMQQLEADRLTRAETTGRLSAEKEALTEALEQMQQDMQQLEADRLTRAETTGRLTAEKEALTEALEQMQQDMQQLEANAEHLCQQYHALDQKNANLTAIMERVENANAELEADRLTRAETTGRLSAEKEALTEALEQMQQDMQQLEANAEHLRQQYHTIDQEHTSVIDAFHHFRDEASRLQAQRDHLQQERDALHRSLLGRGVLWMDSVRRKGWATAFKKIVPAGRTASTIKMFVDYPAHEDSITVADPLYVSGWAFSTDGPIEQIEAFLTDTPLGMLPYGLDRPDVAVVFPAIAEAGKSGYEAVFALNDIDPGSYILSVQATDATGKTRSVQRPVHVLATSASSPNPSSAAARPVPASPPAQVPTNIQEESVPPPVEAEPAARKLDAPKEPPAHQPTVRPIQETALHRTLREFVIAFQTRTDRKPNILDWHTGLLLKKAFPKLAIFSPPSQANRASLPYIDQSVDVVFCPSDEPAFLAEAQRVATGAVLWLDDSGEDEPLLHVRWQERATVAALPSVSIIIPVYNQAHYTRQLLEQLQQTLPDSFTGEILVMDDGSTDETPTMLATLAETWPLLKAMRNPENLGFIGSCNRGAEAATGNFLLFLNNDTMPQPGWFLPLLETFKRYPDAGAVGGKLIFPDGTLQEAGGLIFSDGSGWNFGRHDAAVDHPLYNHVREVDYCSGALLATRRETFLALGGFDTRYRPAYYEDADYCFQLRQHQLKVYYQPESVVIHFEGISSGTDITSGVKQHQAINKRKFMNKWQEALKRQPPPPPAVNQQFRYHLVVRDEYEEGSRYAY